MAQLIPFSYEDDELPSVQCSLCDVIFSVVWNRNGYTDRVEFCPFCGDEIDEDNEYDHY